MSHDSEAKKFKAVGFVNVKVSKSLIDAKKTVVSRRFSCPDDPHPPEFQIQLILGRKEDGYLTIDLLNKSKRNIRIRGDQVALCNEDMTSLSRKKNYDYAINLKSGCAWGYPDFHPLDDAVTSEAEIVEWNIAYTVIYEGVSINLDFLDEYSRKNDLPNDMLKLLESGKDADVAFIVRDEKIKAHKAILKTRSTHFKSMFDSGMKESLTNVVELRDVDPAPFKEALKFLYSGLPPGNLLDVAMDLFPVADRYAILPLRDMCLAAIRRRRKTSSTP